MNIKDDTGKLYYIGGCVRDEILGIESSDIDICYEGDAINYVQSQGFKIIRLQPNIRTARILINDKEYDFASTRKEFYPQKGHLPVTTEIGCPLIDDLTRRDFTINSIAKCIKTKEIIDYTGGQNDIKSKLLRVHHKDSFRDDPTRILRALKFSLRFGFELEENTAIWQKEYLENVNYDMSFSRLKKELIDTFNLNRYEALNRFINEKIYKLVTPNLPLNLPSKNIENLVTKFRIKNPWIAYLGWLDLSNLDLTKDEKKVICDFERLKTVDVNDNYDIYTNCKKSDIRAILLWIMTGNNAGEKYLCELKDISLQITGNDLIKLGVNGKQVGEILNHVLKLKLVNPQMTKEEQLVVVKNIL